MVASKVSKHRCRVCGAPIVWVDPPMGRLHMLDPDLVELVEDPEGRDIVVTALGVKHRGRRAEPGAGTVSGRVPHMYTCDPRKKKANAPKRRKRG